MKSETSNPQLSGKERLLSAAAEVFSTQSYSEAGIAQILDLAKVQAPTLYHHFKDKEGLYTTWAVSSLEALAPILNKIAESDEDILHGLEAYMLGLFRATSVDWRKVLRQSEKLVREESREAVLKAYLSAISDPLVTILNRAKTRGELHASGSLALLTEHFLAGAGVSTQHPWRAVDPLQEATKWWVPVFLRAHR